MAVRTAKQKAAQRKAALASARKRKGRGKGRKPGVRKRLVKRYQKGHTGPGAKIRRQSDKFHSRGFYATNKGAKRRGKSRIVRAYRKSNVIIGVAGYPINAGVYATSAIRNKRRKKRR